MEREACKLSATEAIREIRARKLSVKDFIHSCLEQINRTDPMIHAWAHLREDLALKRAEEIDGEIQTGRFHGKLFGMPVGIKDIYNTKNMPTGMGSPIWEGFMPGNDARSVYYLKSEGGIVLGKTVTAEFAVHFPGPTVNPQNPEHTPGTSSSGSAAAVASFMVPLALGSQTAGSTIRPASYCGIYGFKPSFGMIPRTGVLKTVDLLDHVTLMARTLEDIRLIFDCVRVKGHNFPFVEFELDNPNRQKKEGPWRIAFVRTRLWPNWMEYARLAIENYALRLGECDGVTVEERELPDEFDDAHEIHGVIYEKALSYYYKEEYRNSKEQLSDVFAHMVERGMGISVKEYLQAIHRQVELTMKLDRFFEDYDGILTLSTAGEAPKGLHTPDVIDSCLIWTLCGAPSISVPIFKGPAGLPFGAQLVFKKYRDHDLFHFLSFLKENELI